MCLIMKLCGKLTRLLVAMAQSRARSSHVEMMSLLLLLDIMNALIIPTMFTRQQDSPLTPPKLPQ